MEFLGLTDTNKLRPFDPSMAFRKTPRILRSSVVLPSQQQAFAVCTEIMIDWFTEKFKDKFFNSIYVEGAHSFDEFRKFSTIDQQLKRTNPLLAVIPSIDSSYNREWIDSTPEIPMLLRRSRMEGTFFNDNRHNRGLHLQLMFKTIKMNFVYKIRQDTRGQQLDMMEFIKVHHRAGWSQTLNKDMDIHVPKDIIKQIAFDNGFDISENGNPKNPIEMLNYLNSFSMMPFVYKLRCTTGNDEYFIKVPNCTVHIKSDIPNMDDGQRENMITTNYNIDFPVEVEMTAPYCYTYFSQRDCHNCITGTNNPYDASIAIMRSALTIVPKDDVNHWPLLTTVEYMVDESDLGKPLEIPFRDLFCGTDIAKVISYTRSIGVCPGVFLNFMLFNSGNTLAHNVDWSNLTIKIDSGVGVLSTVIGIYVDMKYVNDAIININGLEQNNSKRAK